MVNVGDVYELVIEIQPSGGATRMLNTMKFRQKAGVLSAINLIAEWQAQAQTSYRALFATDYFIVRYACRSLIPYNTDFYETTLITPLPGTGGTNGVPPVVAQIMTWRTGLPGRRKRGRSYIPGIAATNQAYGRATALHVTNAMNPYGSKILSVYGPTGTSTTTEFGVWSRLNAGPDPPFDPAGFTPVVSFTSQSNLGTMGTRRWGRGM